MIELVGDKVDLPDGIYRGSWSAYTIDITDTAAGSPVFPARTLETRDGCRSIDGWPVNVIIKDGRATAEDAS